MPDHTRARLGAPRSLAARALPFVTWALTFHILVIAVLFGLLRLPPAAVKGIAAWKEMMGLALLLTVVVRAAAGRGPRVQIAMADMFVGGWLSLALVMFATENILWHHRVPITAAVFGVRDAAFFLVFYFVGRSTPEIGEDDRVLRRAFYVLSFTSLVAVLEQIIVTPAMLVAIGVASYVQDFLGTPAAVANNPYGLPDNYWSLMGGHMVRRSGSVFLSSQGFAAIFLVLLPAATIWLLQHRMRRPALAWGAYAVIWAGLIATFTRMAILVGLLQVLIILLVTRRATGAALAATLAGVVGVVALVAMPGLATFVLETLTWQSGSSTSHLKDWSAGVVAFLEQPWGYGLGTTDQTAMRAGLEPITIDNLYLKYAVELGLPGLLLFLGTLTSFAAAGGRLWRAAGTAAQAGLGLTVALATMSIAIYGMTSNIFGNPIVAYLLFWFGGTVVTLAQRTAPADAPVAVAYA